MTARAAPPVRVDAVTKTFGAQTAVADLGFTLAPGTITGFLGPNGAGKTTTLRMIGGLVRPTRGSVELFGIDARQPQARTRVGYMPADPTFLPHLTGLANLDLLARLRGTDDLSERAVLFDVLELPASDLDRPVRGYSSGMLQKLAVVAALQHRPDLVVLDEPANRLDPIAHRAFCRLLADAAADGRTVLLSSHVLAEVEEVCDGVLLVREGRLLASSTVAELRARGSRVVTLTYRSPPRHPPCGLDDVHVSDSTVTGRMSVDRADLVRSLLADPDVVDITVSPSSLEDVVLALYAGGDQ